MWFQLSIASIIAMSIFYIFILCLKWMFQVKAPAINTSRDMWVKNKIPYRTNMHFIRSIPILLGLLGLCIFFIPLAPLLSHYEKTNQLILQQKCGVLLLIFLFIAGVSLLYASIKKSLSWNKNEDENG